MTRKRISRRAAERLLSADKPGSGIPGLGIDPPLKKQRKLRPAKRG